MSDQSCWSRLNQVLGPEDKEQLAQLVLAHLATGFGSVTIEFREHCIYQYQDVASIRTKRKSEMKRRGISEIPVT